MLVTVPPSSQPSEETKTITPINLAATTPAMTTTKLTPPNAPIDNLPVAKHHH